MRAMGDAHVTRTGQTERVQSGRRIFYVDAIYAREGKALGCTGEQSVPTVPGSLAGRPQPVPGSLHLHVKGRLGGPVR